jgi:hypothetical protein
MGRACHTRPRGHALLMGPQPSAYPSPCWGHLWMPLTSGRASGAGLPRGGPQPLPAWRGPRAPGWIVWRTGQRMAPGRRAPYPARHHSCHYWSYKRRGYCWRIYFNGLSPTFLHGIFQALYVRRSCLRGEISGSSEFANSIPPFWGRRDGTLHNPTTLLNQASLAYAFSYATERRGDCAVASKLPIGGRFQASRF